MKVKKRIKQKIREKRGEYTRERRKRFLYLKHTGKYAKVSIKPKQEKAEKKIERKKWWEKVYNFFKRLFKK